MGWDKAGFRDLGENSDLCEEVKASVSKPSEFVASGSEEGKGGVRGKR